MADAIYCKDFSDIVAAVREELKIQTTDTTNVDRIKRLVNHCYLNEVVPYDQWDWLRGKITIIHETALTGTASVTEGAVAVTLDSTPALSRQDYFFSADGSAEIYRIVSHIGGSAAITLDYPFLGSTNSAISYKIWTDALPLPVTAREAIKVTQDNSDVPLEGVGLQKFRDKVIASPKDNGRPRTYTTTDFVDSTPYAEIGGVPSSISRASAGLLKTLTFNTTVAALLEPGDRIKVSGAGHYSYNGEFELSTVSTTVVQYVGTVPYTESTAVDTSWTVELAENEDASERYRELLVYPSINTTKKTALHVDFIQEVRPLAEDADEPLMPISDRIILVYGALMTAWTSIMRSDADAQRNGQLYDRKLSKMQGKLTATTDLPKFQVSRDYLARKRGYRRGGCVDG
jgi:hypothetical protein